MSELSPLRAHHVGSSEVGSLFGAGFATRYELYMRKKGLIDDSIPDNERLEIGRTIEPTIAELVRNRIGAPARNVVVVNRYHVHPEVPHSGASLDYEFRALEGNAFLERLFDFNLIGPGVLELKNVSEGAWFKKWEKGERVPLGYELQVQQQLSVTSRHWGVLAALVGGCELRLFPIHRHDGVIELIEREIPLFWKDVEEGNAPEPDWELDADVVNRIHRIVDDELTVDLSLDAEANLLARQYTAWGEVARDAAKRRKTAKAKLIDRIGDAGLAYLEDGGTIRRKTSQIPEQVRKSHSRISFNVKTEDPIL